MKDELSLAGVLQGRIILKDGTIIEFRGGPCRITTEVDDEVPDNLFDAIRQFDQPDPLKRITFDLRPDDFKRVIPEDEQHNRKTVVTVGGKKPKSGVVALPNVIPGYPDVIIHFDQITPKPKPKRKLR